MCDNIISCCLKLRKKHPLKAKQLCWLGWLGLAAETRLSDAPFGNGRQQSTFNLLSLRMVLASFEEYERQPIVFFYSEKKVGVTPLKVVFFTILQHKKVLHEK